MIEKEKKTHTHTTTTITKYKQTNNQQTNKNNPKNQARMKGFSNLKDLQVLEKFLNKEYFLPKHV